MSPLPNDSAAFANVDFSLNVENSSVIEIRLDPLVTTTPTG